MKVKESRLVSPTPLVTAFIGILKMANEEVWFDA